MEAKVKIKWHEEIEKRRDGTENLIYVACETHPEVVFPLSASHIGARKAKRKIEIDAVRSGLVLDERKLPGKAKVRKCNNDDDGKPSELGAKHVSRELITVFFFFFLLCAPISLCFEGNNRQLAIIEMRGNFLHLQAKYEK